LDIQFLLLSLYQQIKTTDMKITEDFINKVEHSFDTLSESKSGFCVFDDLVKDELENEPVVLETVYKILDLFNSSTPEQLDVLFSIETSEVIKMVK